MLRRLHIRNFKSLRDVEVHPGVNNIFVGPNGAGKSNLIEALKFLVGVTRRGLVPAFSERGGWGEVFWKGSAPSNAISFEMDFDLPAAEGAPQRLCTYILEIEGSVGGPLTVRTEILTVREGAGPVAEIVNLSHGIGALRHFDGSEAVPPPSSATAAVLELNVPGWFGTAVRNYVAQWRFYRLSPAAMKRAPQFAEAAWLAEDGSNLTEFLTTFQMAHKAEFRQLENAFRDGFPSVEALTARPVQQAVLLTYSERHLNSPIQIWNMADGQLAFLALIALIFTPTEMGAPLYCIEEPEAFLHPRLLELLAEMLFGRQSALASESMPLAQIFATTHSPYFVDRVPAEALLVVGKGDDGTSIVRPDEASLRDNLADAGLGELWYSGALGGV